MISFDAIFPNPDVCGAVGSVYMKSRSSTSFTSEIKDFIAPLGVSLSNCTSLTTTAQTPVTLGEPIFDVAHLTGSTLGAGGTITFKAFGPNDPTCAGPPAFTSAAIPVNGDNEYNSGNFTPTAPGTYLWTAAYTGDQHNKGASTACGDENETSVVNKAPSSTATDIHNAAHQVVTSAPIGSTVHDLATVSGTVAGGTPAGNVTFTLYAGTTCAGTGTAAGTVDLVAGVAHPSDSTTVPVGGLSYKATYNGSAVYNASTGPCEPLNATKLDSSTATDIHNAAHQVVTSAPIGSTVHDLATVSGTVAGGTPAGNVTFTLYAGTTCAGTGTAAGTVDLVAGVAHPSDSTTVPVGGLSYKATYNGSAVYNASTGPCEPLNATKLDSSTATDIHNAAHQVVTSAPIGSTVHDLATVSGTVAGGTPAGNVTFTLYAGTTCAGTGTAAGTVDLVAGVAHPSDSTTVPVGGLSYKATYNGSAVYNASTGPCEPLNATKLDSSTATDIHNAAHQVVTSAPIGSTVHDQATVSGTVAGGTPTGNVTFTLYAGTTCAGTGTAAGTVDLVAGVAHPSDSTTVPVGGLSYKATYNGSAVYNASTGPCEPLNATKLDSSTATDIHNAAHQVVTSAPIGSTVHDLATVSGTVAGGTPAGNVTFTLYAGTTCAGTGTAAGTVDLVAGVAHPSDSTTVPVGGLSYKATYNGSAVYNASTGPCEPLNATKLDSSTATDIHNAAHQVVTSAPIGSTVHDKATVTGTVAGGTPTGNVTFTVYAGTTCAGTGTAAGTVDLVAGVAHPSDSTTVPVGGLSYKATYNGSAVYNASTGPCEPLNATKLDSSTATDIHNAAHQVVTSAPIGSTVHDQATVSGTVAGGTPTGNVTFTLYAGTTCAGTGTAAGTVDLVAGVAHPSDSTTVPVGGLSYKATYNGSAVYNASTGPCEPLNATKLDSSTATDIHNAAHQVITSAPIGSTVHDQATVSGTAAGGTPTGNVTFTVYAGTTCAGTGTAAGTVDLVAGVAHPSDSTTVPVGGLSYKATYNGMPTTTRRPVRVSR